ncbi:MAG: TIGR03986 family CRISPR-associated RAMP protein [Desulfobacter postgatei]|uniref:TIGR03986 family type III CRISPR-associated RAMP protein n=1 Tax=Desulfobacter postgatei TaxID=2293 RepID=UPI0023F3892B|nr:TIGR03986 family CRISPR-associated RAMP protein [Desulfobacter postgatei]MDD4273329.1 TIGR03986 family CRISPR-associated RAMP protein [Desulfobacter postgatei]
MSETQTKVENTNKWQFRDFKRWEITGSLTLRSPLHIGDGGTIEKKIKDRSGAIKEVQVNSVITGKNHHPVIPGSTLKGRLRHYFSTHLSDHTLLDQVFGRESGSENDPGHGGLAEFHDANLDQLYQNTCIGYYPHWDDDRKTFIETSTAINRHTRTAMDGSLYYTECVQPGAVFNIKITGSMQDSHAALVVAALEAIRTESNRFCLGAEDAAGKGRVGLTGRVCVKLLDQTQMMDWLEKDSSTAMATSFYRELDEAEIRTLINDHMEPELKPPALPDRTWDLVLHFDGPFVVNAPEQCREDDAPNVYPLTGSDGNPILPVRSFKGSIRSQAERIIRTLGGQCCDGSTGNGCKGPDNLCIACEMFGSTGWKTSLEIDPFIYMNKEERPYIPQDFVAIDRFHGGGADGAKFKAKYSLSPVFKSSISISNRIGEDELSWRKGLLSLLFRDLADGDIYLGFGMNKGYGAVKKADITCNGQPFSVVESDIKAFHDKCRKTPGSYRCDPVKTPEINAIKNDSPPIVPLPTAHSKFYNPYHFIPVKKPNTEAWTEKNKYGKEKSPHSHGFYRKTSDDQTRLYHGRIICRLTSETPFFIGAGIPEGQKGNKERNIAALKENYRLNGKLAIPATSLRGMISSLAEAASNSAMRVMDSGIISYRKPMKPMKPPLTLSALGMVTKRGDVFHLIPLAMPTMKLRQEQYRLDHQYKTMFPDGLAKLKIYLNDAYSNPAMEIFINSTDTWTPDTGRIYYLPLDSLSLKNGSIKKHVRLRTPTGDDRFLIGQKQKTGNGVPSLTSGPNMVPGILRILGKRHREKDIPKNKKHELFIPVPPEFVDDPHGFLDTANTFPIQAKAVEDFEEIARQQTQSQKQEDISLDEERLPFHLKGTCRENDHTIRIKHGDIVYFRPDSTGSEVAEISFSSIWRGKTNGTTDAFLPDENLLPFNRNRNRISPAELLFGFTENSKKEDENDHGLAFAGKLRISAGTLRPKFSQKSETDLLETEVHLKALAAPKPPCPAFYFKDKKTGEAYIEKPNLNAGIHGIQGRKMYLHAMREPEDSSRVQKITSTGKTTGPADQMTWPWIGHLDERNHLKTRCRPVASDIEFFFHLDFNNLSPWEIGLLCYALRPGDTFRHKIGMGKPIGLGTVKIDIAALQTIDRQARYNDSAQNTERYNEGAWVDKKLEKQILELYGENGISSTPGKLNPQDCKKKFTETMDTDIARAIELLGNPGHVKNPVHYPQVNDENIEKENFKWFERNATNEEHGKQRLKPITNGTTHLDLLNR